MRLITAFVAVWLFVLCSHAQSLQKTSTITKFNLVNRADAPFLITITDSLYDVVGLEQAGLDREVFYFAYKGYLYLLLQNKLQNPQYLTIADYSQSSNNKRLYVIDVVNMQLVYQTFVSHGKNSGGVFANSFSNENESNKSSLGFLITAETYVGKYGTALKLDGMETGINNNVRKRDIVLHGSDYVNENTIKQRGHLSRSLGCPAVPKKEHMNIIQTIKNGSCFFIYHPSKWYTLRSKIINAPLDRYFNETELPYYTAR